MSLHIAKWSLDEFTTDYCDSVTQTGNKVFFDMLFIKLFAQLYSAKVKPLKNIFRHYLRLKLIFLMQKLNF